MSGKRRTRGAIMGRASGGQARADGTVFFKRGLLGLLTTLALAGCAVGPEYQRPGIEVGETYKQVDGWVSAAAAPAELPADWWRLFDDAELSSLMHELAQSNQDIRRAEAQYRQARALVSGARSGLFPTVDANAGTTRSGAGGASGNGGAGSQHNLGASVSWEVDVWGRVRRSVESSEGEAQASAADLAATRLSMQSALAQAYFRLRSADAERRFLAQTVSAFERTLEITRHRLDAGLVSQADVASAQSQLENARVQWMAVARERAQYEHAIAVLLGRAPSAFGLTETAVSVAVPAVPRALPSTLLLRRPDVVAAERRVAAANAQIGVAQAAWFPSLTLNAQGGYRSGEWAHWLSAPFSYWSLGPLLAQAIFDGGARQANIEQARAGYEAQAASYRQTVLDALREVEDYLVQSHGLSQEQEVQARALQAARESLRLYTNQFEAGMIDYLSVAQVETNALAAERSALALARDRLLASVQLITALGGGWQGMDAELSETAQGPSGDAP